MAGCSCRGWLAVVRLCRPKQDVCFGTENNIVSIESIKSRFLGGSMERGGDGALSSSTVEFGWCVFFVYCLL